ncbi:P-II family nitrogen regulator [Thermobrachium celere]|uniref:P-II family nitrogen regulator n=1 Tax=Thermobrachium celere TaxID=53422 RepID=UPI001A54228E|nr:P-II family nitrogen regulator [Thermobrachium celere]GFR34790.1 nitrogen regulatory protein P-II [Thermobrachium celere]
MSSSEMIDVEQICIIVNFGLGSKLLQAAKNHGISGGTVLLGKGTVNNRILDFLGLSDIRKEIVLMVANKKTADQVLEKLDEEFKFEKPNHGIAFTTSVCSLVGTRSYKSDNLKEGRGVDNNMYHAITVIVDKGKAENVIDAATKAGSTGGTIINARGSGIHETSKLFSMDIEPEKEIVLILSEKEKTEAIVTSIREQLKIDEPGNGILYIQDVNKTYGLYK